MVSYNNGPTPLSCPKDNCRGREVSKSVTPSLSETYTCIDTVTSSALFQCRFLSLITQILKFSKSYTWSSCCSCLFFYLFPPHPPLSLLSAPLCPFDHGQTGASYLFSSPVEPSRLRGPWLVFPSSEL